MHLQSATTKKSNISNIGSMLFPLYHLVNLNTKVHVGLCRLHGDTKGDT